MLSDSEKIKILNNKGNLNRLSNKLQEKLRVALKNKSFSFESSDDDICCDTGTGPHGYVRCSEDNCLNFLKGTIVPDANCPQ